VAAVKPPSLKPKILILKVLTLITPLKKSEDVHLEAAVLFAKSIAR